MTAMQGVHGTGMVTTSILGMERAILEIGELPFFVTRIAITVETDGPYMTVWYEGGMPVSSAELKRIIDEHSSVPGEEL